MTDLSHDATRRAWLSAERGMFVLIVLLIAALTIIWWTRRGQWRDDPTVASPQPEWRYLDRMDPNTASWQSLACLPNIGELRAKRIIEYRQSHPPFTQPSDLERVSGIGPKIVEGIRPFLSFATSRPDPQLRPTRP